MPFRIGSGSAVAKLYLGSTEVAKMYLGNTEVWAAAPAGDLAISYGTLSLSSVDNGLAVPSGATAISGGTASGYSLNGGKVYPTSNGSADSGTITFTGSSDTWTMTAEANTYTAGSVVQFQAVVGLGTATISDKTLKLLPGSYDTYTDIAGIWWHNKFNDLGGIFTVTSHDQSDRAKLNDFQIYDSTDSAVVGNVTLSYLDFVWDYSAISTPTSTAQSMISAQISGSGRTIRATNVTISNNLFSWLLPQYTTAAFPNGNPYNNANISLGIELSFFKTGIGCENLLIENNEFKESVNALFFICGDGIIIRNNDCHHIWADFISYGPCFSGAGVYVTTENLTVEDNSFHHPTGNFGWRHADFAISYGPNSLADQGVDVTDTIFRRNIVFLGDQTLAQDENGIAAALQFLLMKALGTGATGIYRRFTIEGNVFLSDVVHFVTNEIEMVDSVVRGNTAVRSREQYVEYATSGGVPAISLKATNCDVYQNFAGQVIVDYQGFVPSGNLLQDNVEVILDPATLSGYRALFAGTNFLPTTKAEALAELLVDDAASALDVDSSGSASAGDIGAIGYSVTDGYVNFDTQSFNTGILNVYTVPSAMSSGNWAVATGASNLSITITVNALPSDGNAPITDIEYTTDAGANWRSLGLAATGSTSVSVQSGGTAMSASTSYNILLRAVNSRGNAAQSDQKSATSNVALNPTLTYIGTLTSSLVSTGEVSLGSLTLAAENHLLIFSGRNADDIVSATVANVAATAVGTQIEDSGNTLKLRAFTITPGTPGSLEIEMIRSATTYGSWSCAVYEISNAFVANQITGASSGGNPQVINLDTTTQSGDFYIGAAITNSGDTWTTVAGFDSPADSVITPNGTSAFIAASQDATVGGAETFTLNLAAQFRSVAAGGWLIR